MVGPQGSQKGAGPAGADERVRAGRSHLDAGRLTEAEAELHAALALDATHAGAHHALGRLRERQGDAEEALAGFRAALAKDPSLSDARRRLAALLVELGRTAESLPFWREETETGEEGLAFVRRLIARALGSRNLALAGEYAAIAAELRWGRAWLALADDPAGRRGDTPSLSLSLPKLRHDIEQFLYLQTIGAFGSELDPVVEAYRQVVGLMSARGEEARAAIGGDEHRLIRGVYNRLLHVRPTGRAPRALSGAWDAAAAERQFLDDRPGLAVVDDVLAPDALEALRRFCLESTVWFHNRHAHGRLGAVFEDGFNCPLLLQIAEELQDALPRVIGAGSPLRQVWGFKNAEPLPAGVPTQADFAAVNVVLWITPETANLDGATGGLEIDAPAYWDLGAGDGSDGIARRLRRRDSRSAYVPYRENRAVLFEPDLFGGAAAVSFRPGYENHRISVVLLYGDRQDARPGAARSPRTAH